MEKFIDLTGQKIGKLTVIKKGKGRLTKGGQYKTTWICKCDCGNYSEVDGEKLRTRHTLSCGCNKKKSRSKYFTDLTGQRFGRLTVVRFIKPEEREAKQYNWWCKCDCGKEIKACAYKLKKGLQKSCGCLKEEMKPMIGEKSKKYKYSNKRLYSIWKGMVNRCYDKRNIRYKDYGGRGIRVCSEWKESYDSFAKWAIENYYSPNAEHGMFTIERKDIDGDYCPENCCWITNKEQQKNKRTTVYLEHNGEEKSVVEWSELLNIPYNKLYYNCVTRDRKIEELLNTRG